MTLLGRFAMVLVLVGLATCAFGDRNLAFTVLGVAFVMAMWDLGRNMRS